MVGQYGLVLLGSHPFEGGCRVLVGNAGSEFWGEFVQSVEFSDGSPDPLDRWSRRVGLELSRQAGARAIFPFDGPPYPPFLEWASQTGQVAPSPVSIHIHNDEGLWHAYRFALEFENTPADAKFLGQALPACADCPDKPCLSACPVNAFEAGDYHVQACMDYLRSDENSDCRRFGCAARRACPVKKHNQYHPDHAQFHMNAFVVQEL